MNKYDRIKQYIKYKINNRVFLHEIFKVAVNKNEYHLYQMDKYIILHLNKSLNL
jgi:hypothetical protein